LLLISLLCNLSAREVLRGFSVETAAVNSGANSRLAGVRVDVVALGRHEKPP
jgi:hypothetical protein